MNGIIFETIPHKSQKYDTCGDWGYDGEKGAYYIRVSQMTDWRYEFLVAIHELVEMAWCWKNGVSEEEVTEFDREFEKNRIPGDDSEPGDDLKAPYREGHQLATMIERATALILGVNWRDYCNEVLSLEYE